VDPPRRDPRGDPRPPGSPPLTRGSVGLDVAPPHSTRFRPSSQIDEIVPPGTDVGTLDQEYTPPALQDPKLRRRPVGDRSAA
jgi:hypothetical protein